MFIRVHHRSCSLRLVFRIIRYSPQIWFTESFFEFEHWLSWVNSLNVSLFLIQSYHMTLHPLQSSKAPVPIWTLCPIACAFRLTGHRNFQCSEVYGNHEKLKHKIKSWGSVTWNWKEQLSIFIYSSNLCLTDLFWMGELVKELVIFSDIPNMHTYSSLLPLHLYPCL